MADSIKDAIWGGELGKPMEQQITWGPNPPREGANFGEQCGTM